MKRFSLIFIALFWSLCAMAQVQIPYLGIPAEYSNDAAVDLVSEGKNLMPDEVDALIKKYKGRFDISTLNPVETSDLWKNTFLKTLPADKNPLGDLDQVNYHSPVVTESGLFRFNVHNKSGDGKIYTMLLGKTVHSILLAKNLLRKIGYQIPDVKYLPRVSVKFKNVQEKQSFISYLENVAMAGSAKNWIVDELDESTLLLQDLVVMESNHIIYNLAVGITSDMIQGRRLLSSLVVPLTIVNLTESVNMFRWNAGVINSNHVAFYNDDLENFQCSWDDARWIARRIDKLTRDDWKEIVAGTNTPKAVQMLLVEKIISRRNSAMKLLKIDSEEIKVDSDVSNGVELVKGKLTQENWPGYASRFSYGDPDSPLSASEMWAFFKSKRNSYLIDVAIDQFNQRLIPHTDIKSKNTESFQKIVEAAVQKSIAAKSPQEISVEQWVFPTFRAQLILSRNLVTGTYLGTDNLVQLVDTVGVGLGAGVVAGSSFGAKLKDSAGQLVLGGILGLASPLTVGASAEALMLRTYAHLRPVTSMQKAMKYPFKNIIAPLVKMDYGHKLNDVANLSFKPYVDDPALSTAANDDKRKKAEDLKIKAIEDAFKPLKDSIEVGESLIVTDSLSTYVQVQIGTGYKELMKASLGLIPGHMVVSRFHVHRKNVDEFHLYRDLANEGSIALNFGLESWIPVLKIGMKKSTGNGRVKFFNLNLSPKNPSAISNASKLRQAIVWSSTSGLEDDEATKPYVIKHHFKESTPSFNLFFWQWQRLNSSTDMSITNPKGDERHFRRQYKGTTTGKNYQAYVNGVIARWVDILFKQNIGLSSGTGTNPGYSFKGTAKTKYVSFDEEVDKDGKMIEPFIRLTRIWNGWSIDRKEAEVILDEMKQRYRYEFYTGPVLNSTQRIFLYNISLSMMFYRAGIEHLFSLKDAEISKIFRDNMATDNLVANPTHNKKDEDLDDQSGVKDFLKYMVEFRKYEAKGDSTKANDNLLKAFSDAEDKLTMAGISELMGGPTNFYAGSRIDGFREGDEDGDRTLVSSSLGEYGSAMTLGPVVQMQKQTDMLEGEFFIYWMMTRLI